MTDGRRLWASNGRILQAKLWESKLRGITVHRRKAQNNSLGASQTLWFHFILELESSLRMTRGSLASTSMTVMPILIVPLVIKTIRSKI